MIPRKKIQQGGLYLVVDPKPGLKQVYPKVKSALAGGVDIIQLWDNWDSGKPSPEFIVEICELAHQWQVPVIINNHWNLIKDFPLDGIHFDSIPHNFKAVRKQIKDHIAGTTCGNDNEQVNLAIDNQLDYISFCSMYKSSSANSCDLVDPDMVKEVCSRQKITVFGSGGITFQNMIPLFNLGVDGIAIISAIMNAENPSAAAKKFKDLMISAKKTTK